MESAAIFKNTISQMDFKKSILWYLKVSHNGTKREWENICKTNINEGTSRSKYLN